MPDFLVVPQVPTTSAHPGGCYLCKCDQRQDPNTGALEPMIDTNVLLDLSSAPDDLEAAQHRQGLAGTALVICESCVLEMAAVFGCATPDQVRQMRLDYAELADVAEHTQDKLDDAQIMNRALLEAAASEVFGQRAPEPAGKA